MQKSQMTLVYLQSQIILCSFLLAACKPKIQSPSQAHDSLIQTAVSLGISPSDAAEMMDLAVHTKKSTKMDPYFAKILPKSNSQVQGLLMISPAAHDDGIRMVGWVHGLVPDGTFGFGVHEKGDCQSPDAMSAGPRLDWTDVGQTSQSSSLIPINIKANQSGVARVDMILPGFKFGPDDPRTVLKKAVIIMRDPSPAKNSQSMAEPRFACGVVDKMSNPTP